MHAAADAEEQVIWEGTPSQVVNLKWWLLSILIIPLPFAIYKWLEIRNWQYLLTSERITLRTGILSKRTDSLELYRVRDTVISEPLIYRMFGAGNIEMETSDRTHPTFLLQAVKDPHTIHEQLRRQVEQMRQQKRVREVDFE